jgi:hypothetical protein
VLTNTHWERQVAENAQRCQDLRERLSRLSLTETSRDGLVQVTVSSSGLLAGLVLDDRRQPTSLRQVAAEIMDCVRRAQARIPGLLEQAMVETMGTDDPSTHVILADARKRFPPAPPNRARPRDDDWGDHPVMEDV